MNDGGMKLNSTALSDILQRVMITNALRMIPVSVKGFSFIKCLKLHMTSYTEKSEDDADQNKPNYPSITCKVNNQTVCPMDSEFDQKTGKKRKISLIQKDNYTTLSGNNQGAVRKFHKKFTSSNQ
jgi:hypothetical protein